MFSVVLGTLLALLLSTSTAQAPLPVMPPPTFECRVQISSIVEPKTTAHDAEDLLWLARIISAEARGELIEGQIAVGNVIMNRVAASWYPNTIQGVIFQPGQFCPVSNGSIYDDPTDYAWAAAELVLNNYRIVSERVYFFYNHNIVSSEHWIRGRPVEVIIGNHTFAR